MRAFERPEFTPPAEGGLMRAFGMALLAHAVLVLALSWGLKWKREDAIVSVEAELWANAPVQAAPKPVEAPPAPPPVPQQVAPPPPAPVQRDAEIALERERKEREEQEKARREEAERQKQLAERRREQEREKQEQAKRAAEEKRKQEQAKLRKQQQEEREDQERLAKQRDENMKRIAGMAGATGPREATGTAMRSAGPSSSYAGRLAAHFQRHVVYPGGVDTIAGNPQAVVQVRVSPTGEIVSARLTRSSGNPTWDEAAVRAIERSERIPADVDGRFVSEFPVEMRPKR